MVFRTEPKVEDIQSIREICESTGFFYDFEVDVAVELIEERLKSGEDCGYYFLFADVDGKTVGYTCFGPIACTKYSYDLFWIVTHNEFRGKGIGKSLLKETCHLVNKMGGIGLYAETSARDQYKPTQLFYNATGFKLEAQIKDFYDMDDDKLIYVIRVNEELTKL